MQSRINYKDEMKQLFIQLLEQSKIELNKAEQRLKADSKLKIAVNVEQLNAARREFYVKREKAIANEKFLDKLCEPAGSAAAGSTERVMYELNKKYAFKFFDEPQILKPTGYDSFWIINLDPKMKISKMHVSVYFAAMKLVDGLNSVKKELLERDFTRIENPQKEFQFFLDKIQALIDIFTEKTTDWMFAETKDTIKILNTLMQDKIKFIRFNAQFEDAKPATENMSAASAKPA